MEQPRLDALTPWVWRPCLEEDMPFQFLVSQMAMLLTRYGMQMDPKHNQGDDDSGPDPLAWYRWVQWAQNKIRTESMEGLIPQCMEFEARPACMHVCR